MGIINKAYTLLLIAIIATSVLFIIQPAKAEVENVGTSCSIIVDDVVEGQPINAVVQIYPAPPSGETYNNLFVWITSPAQGISGYGPWGKSHISSDTNGVAKVTFDITTFSGGWNIGVSFEGQYFANNTIYYLPGNWQRNFYVSSAQTPTPSPTASPSPSPSPTPSPTQLPTINTGPEPPQTVPFSTLTVLAVASIVIAIIIASLLLFRSHRKIHNSIFNK